MKFDGVDRMFIGLVVLVIIVVSLAWSQAYPRDLGQWGNADPATRQWFKTLMMPDSPNTSCCGEADAYWCDGLRVSDGKTFCTVTDDRDDAPLGRPHIDVGTEIEIPVYKLKWDRGNPTGHAVVFMGRSGLVYCFVQGSGI